ncbi:response regulator [Sporomusa sp.]|jgi:two-component system chemotaxis response regulator CheY|uniref:response regulator n=1 Tax=Sporomusa sp. TaxID=2078658 RepID=UPI002CB2E7B1|nr:response regulator [Sporomusa sp.]HWR07863.1 response regulator [Sporomusa sp.]
MKVLIVDDAIFMRVTLKQMLEKNGYNVVGDARNGTEGVQKYHELQPDLVTMDITMPEMDGLAALKEIRQINPKAKVLMISGMGQERHVKEAVLAGACGFILKPFNEEQVIRGLSKFK